MSSVTLRNLVEEALVQGVPAISAVEVLPAEPSPTLIPVESLRIGRERPAEGWVTIGPVADLPVDQLSTATVETSSGERLELIVVNIGQRLSAYRNECAHQALPLDNAELDVAGGTFDLPVARILLRRRLR